MTQDANDAFGLLLDEAAFDCVARDADLDLASLRIASTRVLNGGQICLCPDYVFVPRESLDIFVGMVEKQFASFFPEYLNNPGVVSIVNERNYDRVTGLIDDAVSKGARKISVAPEGEASLLPDRQSRRIAPTILLDVPESAHISSDEIFGPVLVVHVYDDIEEVIAYVHDRPSPLAAYWYGEDGDEFKRFLNSTTSGGVTRNDGLVHAVLAGAPFGGTGQSGQGAYHGKAGFDTFTHRRAVANVTQPKGIAEDLVSKVSQGDAFKSAIDGVISKSIEGFRKYAA